MKLICTITGAEVTASEEVAKKLVESGCFRVADAPKRARKTKKEA